MSEHLHDEPIPRGLRAASALVAAQALALLGTAGVLVVKTVAGDPNSVLRALLGAAMALLGAVILVSCARGLLAQRPAARTPVVVLELLALPVSYSLGFQAGLLAYGAPIMLSALAVPYLLFTPAARSVLDRDPGA
jgi:hypothetical protein